MAWQEDGTGFVVQVTTPDWPGLKVCGDGLRVALFGVLDEIFVGFDG